MTRLKKYLLGLGIIAFFLAISLYYINSQNKDDIIKNDEKTQNKVTDTQEIETANSLEVDNDVEADINSNNKNTNTVNSSQIVINKQMESEINKLVNKYYDVTNEFDTDILASKSQSEVEKRIELFTKKKEVIEVYKNISNYIKPGLTDDTFVVFTTYDIKLKNIETKVPGMSVLTVVKSDIEKLLINISPNDLDMDDYIKKLTKEKDIKNVIDDVNIRLTDAIKMDASLKGLVEYLDKMS